MAYERERAARAAAPARSSGPSARRVETEFDHAHPAHLDVLALQRLAGNSAVNGLLEEKETSVHDVVESSGQPLPADTRAEMETRLGHDFSDVRIHTGVAAHESAAGVAANAYTVGSHIAFQNGVFDPSSQAGKTTLAHELTHVVQQRSGPVEGTPTDDGLAISDPGDRFERQAAATAEQAMQRELEET
jgi:hypothetical protein